MLYNFNESQRFKVSANWLDKRSKKIIAEKLMDFQSSTSANILINIPLKFLIKLASWKFFHRPHQFSLKFFKRKTVENSLWQFPIGGIRNPSGSAGKWKGRCPNAKWNCCCCPAKDSTVHLCMFNENNYMET